MKQINIIQYTPYFPPHKGGLETVASEVSKYWVKNSFGTFINVTTEFNQDMCLDDDKIEKIFYKNEVIGYKIDKYEVLVIPSIEIIFNFPMFKFWSKKHKLVKGYVEKKLENDASFRVFTHTRFFLTSLYGGLFAKKHKLQWYHIEHGSGYAKLSSKFKSFIGIIYDNSIGRWIFNNSYQNLAISNACEKFIYSFNASKKIKNKTSVFYRGLDLRSIKINKSGEIKLFFVGRLVSLKGVSDLIEAYKKSGIKNELIIVGDGDETSSLTEQAKGLNIKFLGFQQSEFVINYLSTNNCILINPSYQEGLPTTVIEGLATGCPVIATDVGGTTEISSLEDLVIIKSGDIDTLSHQICEVINNYDLLQGKSLESVNQKFNWDNNIIKLFNILK